jgi:hypothetical protein
MSWDKDWFNSENYLKVYSHRDETKEIELLKILFLKMADHLKNIKYLVTLNKLDLL